MINVGVMERLENGIGNGWYPPVEPEKPRVYHKYLRDMEKENIYGCKCIGTEECTHEDEKDESTEAEDTPVEDNKTPVDENTESNEDDEDPQQPAE